MKESLLGENLSGGRVRCGICAIRCVVRPGGRGVCRTRINRDGTLYTLLYGLAESACADPVEKKPLYHLYPGSLVLSMGARGCNFRCPGCQNWQISHDAPDGKLERLAPAESVRLARESGCMGICWTYNEPGIWLEHTLEAMIEAKRAGLYTAYVTNGYVTRKQMELIGPHLTAWRVDVKAFSREAYRKISGIAKFEPVLEMAEAARHEYGMHVECVTNVTPSINDDEKTARGIASWIRDRLGEMTPWHVTRFHPHLDLSNLPATPIATIDRFCEIGRQEGLKYVYVGNVPGHPREDTHCHACGACVIERRGFAVARASLKEGRCPSCGTDIPGRFQTRIDASTGARLPIFFA